MKDIADRFIKICINKLHEKGLADEKHKDRLRSELKEIETQMEFDYFYDLYSKKEKFPKNDNNLLVPFILDLADDFDIETPSIYVQGEYPDIDSDFLPVVRDYLKTQWAPSVFGKENVCAIGNYTTFGIKSSLIDMVRVHGKDRTEILSLTTKIGLKDDDGKALTWDKALSTYKELNKYCEDNPDVAFAAKRLLNRNRGMGMHAGGIIISNSRIDNLVPLVKGKDNAHVSAFVEGLHGTDLGPLGLIKFDWLVLTNLIQRAKCCKLIKDRHPEITSICALSGQSDWTDTSYLNDAEALALANEGRLKCIFQFDSQGIRELVRKGGVDSFDDLAAYSALYRPGPMGMGMHDVYVKRKRGQEQYVIHPKLESVLGKTYGVMCYQEQIMKILNIVGGIPNEHCEIIRKAISKKKVEIFQRYKEMFLENGQVVLGYTEEQIKEFWNQIECFAEYGFNKAHSVSYAYLSSQLLWLKSHYPLEFFTAILSCEDVAAKIKEYKTEAEQMGIKIAKVDINKSNTKFSIVDNSIYMGFANIKGIGEEVAERIVAGQPYSSFEDFLSRFGTDARVLEPLIALKVFGENSILYQEYYEFYKAERKRIDERRKRFFSKLEEYKQEIAFILNGALSGLESNPMDQDKFVSKYGNFLKDQKEEFLDLIMGDGIFGEDAEQLWSIQKKLKKSTDGFNKKEEDGYLVPFAEFDARGNIEPDKRRALSEPEPIIENVHYGFSWLHLLEFSDDYMGSHTFVDLDDDENTLISMVEVHVIEKPRVKKSKKGNTYYTVRVEDSNSRAETITFWEEDYKRFEEELNVWNGDSLKGPFVQMRVKKPEAPFPSYNFDSPPKMMRHLTIPKDKKEDNRLVIMKTPTVELANIMPVAPAPAKEQRLIDLNKKIIVIE